MNTPPPPPPKKSALFDKCVRMERHIYCSLIFGYTKGVGCSIKGGGGGGEVWQGL